jgi:hypothetical protein
MLAAELVASAPERQTRCGCGAGEVQRFFFFLLSSSSIFLIITVAKDSTVKTSILKLGKNLIL